MSTNGFGQSYAESDLDDPTRKGGVAEEPAEAEKPKHELDSFSKRKLFARLQDWYDQEIMRQSANRYQMALDEDYYDSMQWTEEEAQELLDRGQAPLVFNEIKPTIDWLIGTERRTRIDYKILPRRGDKEASADAERKTMLLKYLSEINHSTFVRSTAFESAAKAGLGWIEVGVRGDPTEEPLYTRNENWRNVIYDSASVELDYSDGRYLFRNRWTDDDIAVAYFPDRADIIALATEKGGLFDETEEDDIWYMGARVTQPGHDYASVRTGKYHPFSGSAYAFNRRTRVKLTECWYKQPVLRRRFNGGEFDTQPFDKNNPEHLEALKHYSLYDKVEMEVRCAIFCSAGLLWEGKSPYSHGRIPFVPVWCYRRKRDNAPYGKVRDLRDPQDDLNKRQSKALWALSTNRILAEEGAVDDWDELREEAARPDALLVAKAGKRLELDNNTQVAETHLMMMDRDVQHIRNTGGVNNENLGRTTNVTSGVALQERKEAGSVATTVVFDNLRLAWQLVGELELANIEQFYTEEKVVRLLDERGQVKFETLNQQDETGNILNDVTAFKADFVIAEQDYRSSLRQAMFESLFDIVGRLAQMNPQVALNLLDLVVEMADLPNRDQLVARIRQLNGQRDPDAEMTPEEEQAALAQQKAAEEQAAFAKESAMAQLRKLNAEADKLDSQALQTRLSAIYGALQAGQIVSSVPGVAAVADSLMADSGFKVPNSPAAGQADAAVEQAAQGINPQGLPPGLAPGGEMADGPPPGAQEMPSAAVGLNRGIETPENDGVRNG